MVSQDQAKHTGQTQAPLSSGTSSSSPKSESNEFVALPFSSSWSHRASRSTQVRPKLLCLQAPQARVQSQRAENLSPCHFPRHGLTGAVEAHRPDPSPFVFWHPQALVQSQRAMNLSPFHFPRHGLTGSVEAHRSDPSSFVFRHLKLESKVREQ